MKKTTSIALTPFQRRLLGAAALMGAAALFTGCDEAPSGGAASGSAEAKGSSAAQAPSAEPPKAAAEVSAIPVASAAPPAAVATDSAPVAAGSAAAAAPKKFDCGAKGEKPCPLQGWMKSVMGTASASGEGDKLSSALTSSAGKAPPGMGNWASIAMDGAAKAKAGDIDGAKTSCKKCHDMYKEKYVKTMRDRPI